LSLPHFEQRIGSPEGACDSLSHLPPPTRRDQHDGKAGEGAPDEALVVTVVRRTPKETVSADNFHESDSATRVGEVCLNRREGWRKDCYLKAPYARPPISLGSALIRANDLDRANVGTVLDSAPF
jgi:hypothetical protein